MTSKLLWAMLGAVLMFAGSAAAQEQKPPEICRIVTGLDASGKAVVPEPARPEPARTRATC